MKKISTHLQSARGQTLVEVIVVVGVVILLVTGLVAGTVSSLRTNQSGRDRALATKYVQEGIELSRKLRDNSWSTFFSYGLPAGKLWCLSKVGTWSDTLPCSINIDTVYTRSVSFTWDVANSRMEVKSTVSWNDGNGNHQSQLSTYFTQWQ